MLLDYLVFFLTSKCFVLFEIIFLLKFISLLSKSVFLTESVCFYLAAKFSAVNLLNSWVVVVYLARSGILFSISPILDHWLWLEVSYKLRSAFPFIFPSFCPSLCPSFFPAVFLKLVCYFFFLKLNMMLGAHMEMCIMEPDFFGEISFLAKMTTNCQKWPRNGVFVFLGKSIH